MEDTNKEEQDKSGEAEVAKEEAVTKSVEDKNNEAMDEEKVVQTE